MRVLNKEAVHEEAVAEARRTDQDHREAVVGDVSKVARTDDVVDEQANGICLLYTSPSPRDS